MESPESPKNDVVQKKERPQSAVSPLIPKPNEHKRAVSPSSSQKTKRSKVSQEQADTVEALTPFIELPRPAAKATGLVKLQT
jgi:hypothetical protein